jgi:hypothetical protein
MSCECYRIPGRGGAAVACTCDEPKPKLSLAAWLDARARGGAYEKKKLDLSEQPEEDPHMSTAEELQVISPNRSPHRFGVRPKSPTLAKEYDKRVAAQKAREEYEDELRQEIVAEREEAERKARRQRDKERLARQMGMTA